MKIGDKFVRGRYGYELIDAIMQPIKVQKGEEPDYKMVAPIWKRSINDRPPSADRFEGQSEEQRDKKLRAAMQKRERKRRARSGN